MLCSLLGPPTLSNMEDIFYFIREGNVMQVRMWLDDTEHDMNQG